MICLSPLLMITLLFSSFPILHSTPTRLTTVKARHLQKEGEMSRLNLSVKRITRGEELLEFDPLTTTIKNYLLEEELSELLDNAGSSSSQNEYQDNLALVKIETGDKSSITRMRGCHPDELNEPSNAWNWMTTVKCSGLTNLSISLKQIPVKLIPQITTIRITSSYLPILDFTHFSSFPFLQSLSLVECNISEISGLIPASLKMLNLSHNQLKSVPDTILTENLRKEFLSVNEKSQTNLEQLKSDPATSFDYMSTKSSQDFRHNYHLKAEDGIGMTSSFGESDPRDVQNRSGIRNNGDSDTDTNDWVQTPGSESKLEVIDLSHNKITGLPRSIFYLERLQSLLLAGNHLKCDFVWEKLWGWTQKNSSVSKQSILRDANETFCGVDEDVRVFQYTVAGVLQARRDLEETCATVNTTLCRDCRLYALQKESVPQSVDALNRSPPRIWISLKLDCSSQNLTQLPPIPPQTWQLNISHNLIRDLSPLSKEEMYSNLINLDVSSNAVNPESLSSSPFIDQYNYLNLQNNGLATIPTYLLTSLKVIRGQGVTFLGNNYIDCDCNYFREIKPLLIENSKRIRDMKDIFCSNGPTPNMRLIDLQYSDVCHMDTFSDTEFNSDLVTYIIILVEVLFILIIILKLWHDQRTYRRTGNLPWCSVNMPRLPCDAMLESLKEAPNLRHRSSGCGGIGGSAASSNTNIVQGPRQVSVSHIQLKDFRPGSSTVSEIQIPKSSSSGSRTSSV